MSQFALFVDAGHGSIAPNRRVYLTPGKRYFHDGKTLHDGGWFYEGVSNRIYAEEFVKMCEGLGVKVFKTYHEYLDTPLNDRAKMVNSYSTTFEKALLISFHHNASRTGRARGFSAWTTPGNTKSDKVASDLIDAYKRLLPDHKVISDMKDGDADFEADFYILRAVKTPAVLLEYLFFDNPYDVDIIVHDAEARTKYLQACLEAVQKYFGLTPA